MSARINFSRLGNLDACTQEFMRAYEARVAPLRRQLGDLYAEMAAAEQQLTDELTRCRATEGGRSMTRRNRQFRSTGGVCGANFQTSYRLRVEPLRQRIASLQRQIAAVEQELDRDVNTCRARQAQANVPPPGFRGSTGPPPPRSETRGAQFQMADVLEAAPEAQTSSSRTRVQRIYDGRTSCMSTSCARQWSL